MALIMEKDFEGNTPVGNRSRRNSGSSDQSMKPDQETGPRQKVNSNIQDPEKVVLASEDINAAAAAGPAPMDPVPPLPKPSPVPNGGFHAWIQVLGCAFLFFNTWGLINAYGAFQTYYMADILRHESASNISWVGSIQSFLILSVGTIIGPIFDAGHFNFLIRTGSICLVLGLMMTSLCKELWQLVLAQGILTGIGGGLLFLPSVAIIPQYFSTRKSLATGFASAGSSTGGILYPIIFHRLQPRIGFPWATRVIGFIALSTLLVSCAVLKVRVYPSGKRKLVQLEAYREPAFVINQMACFFAFTGFIAPFFYLESYSLAQPQDDKSVAFYLLPIILAGSFFGRILPNFFADKTGPFLVLIPGCYISGMLALCWIAIKSTPGLIAFAALLGFFTGGIVSITPLTVVAITPNYRDLGTRMGMFMGGAAIATLIGAPILGAILNDTGSYVGVQVFCGVLLIVGGTLWIPTYWFATRDHDRRKAVEGFSVQGGGGAVAAENKDLK